MSRERIAVMIRHVRLPRFPVAFAVLALAAAWVLAPSAGAQQPGAGKKVLIVWGGWPGHQPKETVDVFAPWLTEQGFDVEISNSLDSYLDAAKMKSLSLIVQAVTMGTITPQQERGLRDAVEGAWASPAGTAGWPTRSARTRSTSSWWAAPGWPTRGTSSSTP